MLKIISDNKSIIIFHSMGWLFYITYQLLNMYLTQGTDDMYWDDLLIFFIAIAYLLYSFIYISIPSFASKRNIFLSIFILILNIAVYYLIMYSRTILALWLDPLEKMPIYATNIKLFLINYFTDLVLVFAVALAYWYSQNIIGKEKQIAFINNEKNITQMDFLKSQINQHFIYNTLNHFYGQALKFSEPLADGINSLSELLRYSLSVDSTRVIKLKDELHFLDIYISLQKMRFSNKILVSKEIDNSIGERPFLHMALITLAENAFKHGDLREFPLTIKVFKNDNQTCVEFHNIKSNATSVLKNTNLGLINLKNRLELQFLNRYDFKTELIGNTFSAYLFISNLPDEEVL